MPSVPTSLVGITVPTSLLEQHIESFHFSPFYMSASIKVSSKASLCMEGLIVLNTQLVLHCTDYKPPLSITLS